MRRAVNWRFCSKYSSQKAVTPRESPQGFLELVVDPRVMTSHRQSNYGQGVIVLEENRVDGTGVDPMRLLSRLTAPDYQPPVLPTVALELLALSRKPSIGIRDIAALLERDPVLTADTLRIAQSAAFQGASPIRSIDEALVRMGLRRASDLFFRAALESKLFRCGASVAAFERLRKHSVATADLSRLVCRQTSLFDDSAYLCGLLHDVGIAGCMLAIGCERKDNPNGTFEQLWPSIHAVHAQFALHIAVLWNLPQELRLVLSHHLAFGVTDPVHPLAAVTYLAEHLAVQLGAAFADENEGLFVSKATNALRITDVQFQHLKQVAKETVAQLT